MEDVHHLTATAKEDSYLFLVDSRARDTAVFPTPSEYEVSFASPFRNVFGMDLLDVTVARTEYIVESNTNTLVYALGRPASLDEWASGAWARGRAVTVTMTPGDYNLPQFIEHLNAKLASAATENTPLVCRAVTNPTDVSNKIRFACSAPFTLLMAPSTLRHTLGFGDPVVTSAAPEYASVPGWSVNRTGGASDAFLSKPSLLLDEEPRVATIGPLPVESSSAYVPVHAGTVLRQHFESAVDGPPTLVLAYVLGSGTPPQLTVRLCRADDDTEVAAGVLVAVANDPDSVFVPRRCALTSTAAMAAGQQYYVEFATAAGSAANFVGVYFNNDNLGSSDARFMVVDGVVAYPGKNACVDVVAGTDGHSVTCPGVVNLSGPRYVNIRCPEIESHMFRDRINERCHAGLGIVQLRGYGFREQRYDFTSFPPRRFHPLGKLSKLTFRLERPDGTLYDSHGVDHTLLLVLRFYRTAALPFDSGRLNPQYTPDIRHHLVHERWAQEVAAGERGAAYQ